jgi:hypothetical protein
LTAVDVHLLKLAKKATEGGAAVEEVDQLLSTVAIPEALIAGEEDHDSETTSLTATGDQVSESALLLLRQMAATLDRLEARDKRYDQLAEEVAELRRLVESPPVASSPAPVVETPKPSPWVRYLPFVIAVAVVVFVILVIVLVVALLR